MKEHKELTKLKAKIEEWTKNISIRKTDGRIGRTTSALRVWHFPDGRIPNLDVQEKQKKAEEEDAVDEVIKASVDSLGRVRVLLGIALAINMEITVKIKCGDLISVAALQTQRDRITNLARKLMIKNNKPT